MLNFCFIIPFPSVSMFVVSMFHTELVIIFMVYLRTKVHMSNSYISLVITIKLISTHTFYVASILFYIL
jgi:hypothetical protein